MDHAFERLGSVSNVRVWPFSEVATGSGIVFGPRRKLIFVHGCFWHQHDCRLGSKRPRARPDYWLPKLQRNKERDARNLEALRAAGCSPVQSQTYRGLGFTTSFLS